MKEPFFYTIQLFCFDTERTKERKVMVILSHGFITLSLYCREGKKAELITVDYHVDGFS